MSPKKVLHCYSRADKRYSAFCARVMFWGKEDTIENHYQLCKRFGEEVPRGWKDAKGRTPTHLFIAGKELPVEYLSQFYKMLWMFYLDENPGLVEYAKKFDCFYDKYRGTSQNCQADVIEQYVKQGKQSVWNDCEGLMLLLDRPNKIRTIYNNRRRNNDKFR